jgi:hypothetical protein
VAELLVEFADPVSNAGKSYIARACGDEMPDGMWQGWIEFIPIGDGEPVRSGRETTQPNRVDTEYWATGLTPIFLEGSLSRALNPLRRTLARPPDAPIFSTPAEPIRSGPPAHESILDPFSVYRKGETLLRGQLSAFSAWHLVNIVRAYKLSDADPAVLQRQQPSQLVELIVGAVRDETRAAR